MVKLGFIRQNGSVINICGNLRRIYNIIHMYRQPIIPQPDSICNEFTLQREATNWLSTYHQNIIFTSTCGGAGSRTTHHKMMATGYLKGIPDMLILNPPIAIEFKWQNRPLRPDQIKVINELKQVGIWKVFVIRSYDEFVNVMTRELQPNVVS